MNTHMHTNTHMYTCIHTKIDAQRHRQREHRYAMMHRHHHHDQYTNKGHYTRNGTGAKGGLFQTLSDQILQLFSSLTLLAP